MPKSVRGVMHEFKNGQLHSGSSNGPKVTSRPQAVAIALSEQRQMHPKMQAHGQMVKEAHAHLAKEIPGFHGLPAHQRMAASQEHVRQRVKNGHGLY